jgi:hypothetical protein
MKTKVMPNVLFCSVLECAYNDHEKCHAGAITVDGPEPLCDTFFKSQQKGGIDESIGSVGACKNDMCVHNESYECTANGIEVSLHSMKPECDTFLVKSRG